MMETIIAIAGAVQLTRCIMALIEALEKPSAPPPTKATGKELEEHPERVQTNYTAPAPLCQRVAFQIAPFFL